MADLVGHRLTLVRAAACVDETAPVWLVVIRAWCHVRHLFSPLITKKADCIHALAEEGAIMAPTQETHVLPGSEKAQTEESRLPRSVPVRAPSEALGKVRLFGKPRRRVNSFDSAPVDSTAQAPGCLRGAPSTPTQRCPNPPWWRKPARSQEGFAA